MGYHTLSLGHSLLKPPPLGVLWSDSATALSTGRADASGKGEHLPTVTILIVTVLFPLRTSPHHLMFGRKPDTGTLERSVVLVSLCFFFCSFRFSLIFLFFYLFLLCPLLKELSVRRM